MMEIWLLVITIGTMTTLLVQALTVAFSYFEIQIEGEDSLARNLPAWKIEFIKIRRFVINLDKPITGYHVSLTVLVHLLFLFTAAIIVLVMISIIGIEQTIDLLKYVWEQLNVEFFYLLKHIFLVLYSMVLLVILFEDFLWNVMNMSDQFGVKNFSKYYPQVGEPNFVAKNIPLPRHYIYLTVVSFLMAYFAEIAAIWLVVMAEMLVITLVMAVWRYRIDCRKEKQSLLQK
ncbi:hypothetical protein GQ568_01100 [Patescibacteria group bacterium]|nr:hypothetical protein [Patescibacteria group bacterium]